MEKEVGLGEWLGGGRRRSRPEEGLLLQFRQEILVIGLGWWPQRFRATVRIKT